jgi:hypothetical protein
VWAFYPSVSFYSGSGLERVQARGGEHFEIDQKVDTPCGWILFIGDITIGKDEGSPCG